MSEEATLYSPVIRQVDGRATVEFAADHPGYHDAAYQRHRATIADAALAYRPGDPVPEIRYTDEEHDLWRTVAGALREKHERYACRQFLQGARDLALPMDRLPQLAEASAVIEGLTGFTFSPAAGLVDMVQFYGSFADRRFQATQYIRHRAFPHFSPEPDMIHEVVGHGSALANARLARLYEAFGHAVRKLRSRTAVEEVSRVFWFAMEYGVVDEDGELKACGASLLSSCGELETFREAVVRPLSVPEMLRQSYAVDKFQPVLFCAESFDHFEWFLEDYLDGVRDTDQPAARHGSHSLRAGIR
jgi:phenylalanine-4-hydroxylase